MAYTLIGPDATALTIGPGSNGLFGRQLQRLGADTCTRGPAFADAGRWGPEIQRGVTAARLPAALAELGAGRRVDFGDVTVDRNTLTVRGKTRDWTDLAPLRLWQGQVWFADTRGRHALPAVAAYAIPNLYTLLTLAERLRS